MDALKSNGRIIDATTYRNGITNMEPGVKWDMVFVARRANRAKNKELLCAVVSMPDFYAALAYQAHLENQVRELKKEISMFRQLREKLQKLASNMWKH